MIKHTISQHQRKFLQWVLDNFPNDIFNFSQDQHLTLNETLTFGEYDDKNGKDNLNNIRTGYLHLYIRYQKLEYQKLEYQKFDRDDFRSFY